MKCLQKNPAKRYATADELAADLDRFLNGRPIEARPVRVFEKSVKWVRRRPVVAVLISVIVLITLVGNAGIIWQWNEAETAKKRSDKNANLAKAARQESEKRAELLDQSEKTLRVELHKSRLLEGDNQFQNGNNARAEQIYWTENLNSPLEDPILSRWRLINFYLKVPRNGEIADRVRFFSQKGNLIAITSDDRLRVYDHERNELVCQFQSTIGPLSRPAISLDGKFVACGHMISKSISVWNIGQPDDEVVTFTTDYKARQDRLSTIVNIILSTAAADEQMKNGLDLAKTQKLFGSPSLRFESENRLWAVNGAGIFSCDLESQKIDLIRAYKPSWLRRRLIGLSDNGMVYYTFRKPRGSTVFHELITRLDLSNPESKPEYLFVDEQNFHFAAKGEDANLINGNIAGYSASQNRLAVLGKPDPLGENDVGAKVTVVDLETDQVLGTVSDFEQRIGNLYSISFSLDGSLMALEGSYQIETYSVPDLKRISKLKPMNKLRDPFSQTHVAISEDNSKLLVQEKGVSSTVLSEYLILRPRLFNETTRPIGVSAELFFATNGRTVSLDTRSEQWYKSVNVVTVWDGKTIIKEREYKKRFFDIGTLGVGLNRAKQEILVSRGGGNSSIDVLDSTTMDLKASIDLGKKPEPSSSFLGSYLGRPLIAPRGDLAAIFDKGQLILVDLSENQPRAHIYPGILGSQATAAFSTSGQFLLFSGRTDPVFANFQIAILETETAKTIAKTSLKSFVASSCWLPGDKTICVAVYQPPTIEFRNASDLSLIQSVDLSEPVFAIAASPSEPIIACGTERGTILFIDSVHYSVVAEFNTLPKGLNATRQIKRLQFVDNGSAIRYVADNVEGKIDFKVGLARMKRNRPDQ